MLQLDILVVITTHRIERTVLTIYRHVLRSNHRSKVFVYVYISRGVATKLDTNTNCGDVTQTERWFGKVLGDRRVISAIYAHTRAISSCPPLMRLLYIFFCCDVMLDDLRMHLTRCTFFWRGFQLYVSPLYKG